MNLESLTWPTGTMASNWGGTKIRFQGYCIEWSITYLSLSLKIGDPVRLRAVRNKVDKNKNAAPPLDRMSRSFLHPNYLSFINTSNYSVFLPTAGATCPGYLVYIGWNNLVEHGMHPHLNACIGLDIIGFTFRWNFIWGTAVKKIYSDNWIWFTVWFYYSSESTRIKIGFICPVAR